MSRRNHAGSQIADGSPNGPATSRGQVHPCSGAVLEPRGAGLLGTVRTAKDLAILLDTVADDFATAMRASRRQRVDRAFEGVEGVLPAAHRDLERLVVLVAAHVALRHELSPVHEGISDRSAGQVCKCGADLKRTEGQ